jgi:hypothetical protein
MKPETVNKITRMFHKTKFQINKYSPEILLGVGIVGVIGSTIMACKATTKIHTVLDDAKDQIDTIHKGVEDGKVIGIVDGAEVPVDYSQKDGDKDLTITYAKTGMSLAKLYGPAVLVGVSSVVCILASYNIIHKRNVALAAAYATIDNSFKQYRSRVVERFGQELDRELRYNIKSHEVEEIVKDEDGKESVVKNKIVTANIDPDNEYARFFDEYCRGWRKDAEYNRMFIQQIQNWANNKLQTEGFLYLNDVYEMLGFDKTKAGQVVGWIYDKTGELGIGDNYVDFGIYDLHDERKRDFINGRERSVLLDFNVDGNIWQLMK